MPSQLKIRNMYGGLRELTLLLYLASRSELMDKAEVRAMALATVLRREAGLSCKLWAGSQPMTFRILWHRNHVLSGSVRREEGRLSWKPANAGYDI